MVLEQTCHGCLQWDLWGLKLPRFDIWWKIHLAIAQPLKWIQGIYHIECFLFRGWNNADMAKTFQHPKLKVLWRIGIHQSWNWISKKHTPLKESNQTNPHQNSPYNVRFFWILLHTCRSCNLKFITSKRPRQVAAWMAALVLRSEDRWSQSKKFRRVLRSTNNNSNRNKKEKEKENGKKKQNNNMNKDE